MEYFIWEIKQMEYRYDGEVLHIKCNKCWEWKYINDFPPRKDWTFWVRNCCRACWKSAMKESHKIWYQNNTNKAKSKMKDYYRLNRDWINERIKRNADTHTDELWFKRYTFHAKAKNYINNHKLRPRLCPICWLEKHIEAHHPSYERFDKWSEIVFCCHKCHSDIHNWTIECPTPINLLECNRH